MYLIKLLYAEFQFVHPNPKEDELIISAPFRAGVFSDNQRTYKINKRAFIEIINTKKGTGDDFCPPEKHKLHTELALHRPLFKNLNKPSYHEEK